MQLISRFLVNRLQCEACDKLTVTGKLRKVEIKQCITKLIETINPKNGVCFILFIYLFWGFPSNSRIFHSYNRWPDRYWWRSQNLDLYSTLMVIRQWGTPNQPHLTWGGSSVYHGHLRGPVYQWSWNYLFDRLGSVATEIRTTKLPHAKRTQIEIKQLTTGLR